jgi:RNA polymerase sigma-70 factor (ECF subfamily)
MAHALGAPNTLIAAAQRGDRKALEQLLEMEQQRIYAFGLKMCRNQEEAKDVLQDTMLAVARSIGEFRGEASLPTWLFQIARSFCIKKRRLRKGAPRTTESLEAPGAMGVADAAPNPEQTTRGKELELLLNEALSALPTASREVLVLRDVEGLTAPEVAEVLGVSVAAVKSKLHRARAALHKLLQPKLAADLAAKPTPDCPDIFAMYSQQLEGDLTGALCAKMEKHVLHCERCSASCDALKQSLALCKMLPVVPEDVKNDVRRSFQMALSLPNAK